MPRFFLHVCTYASMLSNQPGLFAMSTPAFYDSLTPYYHLIYPDWEASMGRQGRALDSVIRSEGGPHLRTVLDAASGIGTQSLALAALGYDLTASDISPAAIERAQREARQRGLSLQASVADMRYVHDHHHRTFDVVIACDNSVPHLLSDADILTALQQFYACTSQDGICILSARDYATVDLTGPPQFQPYGIREAAGSRYVLFQVWESSPPLYDTTFYVIEHPAHAEPVVRANRTTYYAVSLARLAELMEEAGFTAVRRIDEVFFQPLLVGRKLS